MTFRPSLVLATLALCLLTACGTLRDYTVTKQSTIDKQIVAARAETESQLRALNDQQLTLLKQSIGAHEAREQGAADYLFKGVTAFHTLKTLTRPEMVMGQSMQQTAAQLPPASPAAQAKAYEDLKTELDETRVSTEVLRTQYETELGKARAEGVAKDKALTDLTSTLKHLDDEKVTILTRAKDTEAELSDKRKAVTDAEIATKTREAESAKSTQAIKLKLSSITGVLMLLCIAGAIWSPVFKQQLGLGAVVLGIVTAAIWYIQPWHIAVLIGVALVWLIGWAVKNHYIASKTASNVFHAIEQVKTTARADYDRLLAPALAEWQTVYTKDGKTVPDQAAIAHVDSVLMATGAK